MAAISLFLYMGNKHLKTELNAANGEIARKDEYIFTLEHSIKEMQDNIAIYAKADEQNEQFKGKMNEDTTDNLDVVPADYILKQLRAD